MVKWLSGVGLLLLISLVIVNGIVLYKVNSLTKVRVSDINVVSDSVMVSIRTLMNVNDSISKVRVDGMIKLINSNNMMIDSLVNRVKIIDYDIKRVNNIRLVSNDDVKREWSGW